MSKKVGSDGQIRKTTAEWTADTGTYPEGMRLMDTDTGTVKVSSGGTYAAAWSQGGGGGETPVGLGYVFDDGTSAPGISNGQIRFNSATAGSITAIYIAQTDANGNDMGTALATFSAGGLLYVNVTSDDTAYSVFKVTAAVERGGYYTLTATYLSGVLPNDGGAVRVTIAPFCPEINGSPVIITDLQIGHVLTFDGTNWINQAP